MLASYPDHPSPRRLPRTSPSHRGGDRPPLAPAAPVPLPSLLQDVTPDRAPAPVLRLAARLYGRVRRSDVPQSDILARPAPGLRLAAQRRLQSGRRGPPDNVVQQPPG